MPVSKSWYYLSDVGPVGPLRREQMTAMMTAGQLSGQSMVWADGMTGWAEAASLEDIRPDLLAGRALGAFIVGLVSLLCLLTPLMLVGGIAGLVIGIPAMRSTTRRGMAIAGVVLSALAIAIVVVLGVALLSIVRHLGRIPLPPGMTYQ